MNRWILAIAALVAAYAPIGVARAEQQKWAAAYIDWDVSRAGAGVELAQRMWIAQPAVASFFTLNWDFVAGDGGYIGLQSDEAGAGNVRFSLWNATAAKGAACRRFDGEGEGMTCVLPVRLDADAVFRVRITRGAADAQGQWWIGWIEAPGAAAQQIGALRVGANMTAITPDGLHNFSEYWGAAERACRSVPLSAAAFAAPNFVSATGARVIGVEPVGRRPNGHPCATGKERTGAVAGHKPMQLAGAPAMLMTLGGDAAANAALLQKLAAQAPE